MEQTYKFRSRNRDGTIEELEITGEQALDLAAGQPISYIPRDERILVDSEGQIVHRASAIP